MVRVMWAACFRRTAAVRGAAARRGTAGAGGAATGGVGCGGSGYDSESAFAPTDLGSGGGNNSDGNPAGAGGGAIHLVVADTLTLGGLITANGLQPAVGDHGGGSGGSIWVSTHSLTGAGSFSAQGG